MSKYNIPGQGHLAGLAFLDDLYSAKYTAMMDQAAKDYREALGKAIEQNRKESRDAERLRATKHNKQQDKGTPKKRKES